MIYQYFYSKDKVTKEYTEMAPVFLQGLHLEELQSIYLDWQVVLFSPEKVILRCKIDGLSSETYILGEMDGFLAVFYEDAQKGIHLKEKTLLPLSALPEEEAEEIENDIFRVSKTGNYKCEIGAYESDFPLMIRNFKPGDKIRLKNGTKKVSRIFIDKKVPRTIRENYPVVLNKDNDVIFVPKGENVLMNFGPNTAYLDMQAPDNKIMSDMQELVRRTYTTVDVRKGSHADKVIGSLLSENI